MLDYFLRFERLMSRFALAAAVLMLIVSVTLGFYQVLTRFVLDAPSTWSEVMSRSAMIWCVFLGAAASFRGGYMMAVEVIYKLVPARGLLLVESFITLCCIIVLAVLIHYGILMTMRVSSQTLSGMGISIAWAYAAIPVGASFSMLAVLARIAAQATRREPIGPSEAERPSVNEQQQTTRSSIPKTAAGISGSAVSPPTPPAAPKLGGRARP